MTAIVSASAGAAGVALLGVAIWRRWSWLVGWGLLALGVSYGAWVVAGATRSLAVAAPLVAAGMLAVGEAAFYGAERRHGTEYGARQLAWLAIVSLAALSLSAVMLLAAAVSTSRSLALTVAGAVAAAVAIAVPSSRFGRPTLRARDERQSPDG